MSFFTGKHYPAEVLSVFTRKDIEMCRVKFLDYDDEAEVRNPSSMNR
jgi:hypothetical protein